jgi:hypothetical protein
MRQQLVKILFSLLALPAFLGWPGPFGDGPSSLADRAVVNGCPQGTHWDAAQNKCVPDTQV